MVVTMKRAVLRDPTIISLEDINQLFPPKCWYKYLLSYMASIQEDSNIFSYNYYFMLTVLSSHNHICS
jgi:hypothetical protein